MSATNAERTRPDVLLPAFAEAPRPSDGDTRARERGPVSPGTDGASRPRRSFLPPPKPRAARALPTGGAPPTVIRNLDALFAADHRRRSTPPPAPSRRDPSSGVHPIDPAHFAQALLDKVQHDFARPAPAPRTPAPIAVRRSRTDEVTELVPLPVDDPDLVALVPWYVRLYRRLFGG